MGDDGTPIRDDATASAMLGMSSSDEQKWRNWRNWWRAEILQENPYVRPVRQPPDVGPPVGDTVPEAWRPSPAEMAWRC